MTNLQLKSPEIIKHLCVVKLQYNEFSKSVEKKRYGDIT